MFVLVFTMSWKLNKYKRHHHMYAIICVSTNSEMAEYKQTVITAIQSTNRKICTVIEEISIHFIKLTLNLFKLKMCT